MENKQKNKTKEDRSLEIWTRLFGLITLALILYNIAWTVMQNTLLSD